MHTASEHRSYKLVQRIATGGMGEVFLAALEGSAGFNRRVVVKKIHPRWAHNEDVLSLFRDEARLGAALDHPNIVSVLDYGRSPEGTFLVLEYVPGRNFAELITAATDKRRYLPTEIVAWVGLQCCKALEHIHGRTTRGGDHLGVVHRDINPANVLLSFAGETKLTDFGVAAGHHRELKTAHGILRGTFPYMSPEQTRCKPLDGRSDLFSLGIVLYEGLTAHHPFADDEDYLTIKAIQEEEPPSPRGLRNDVDPALDAIVMRSIAKDPEDRYSDARAMADDLLAWLRDRQVRSGAADLSELMERLFPDQGQRGEAIDAFRISLGPTTPGRAPKPLLDLTSLDLRPGNKRVGGAIVPNDPDEVKPAASLHEPVEFDPVGPPPLRDVAPPALPTQLPGPVPRRTLPPSAQIQRGPVSMDGIRKAPAARPPRAAEAILPYLMGLTSVAALVGGLVYLVLRFT